MTQTPVAVRFKDLTKALYKVDLLDHEEIRAAVRSELPTAQVILISVPCSKPQLHLEPEAA